MSSTGEAGRHRPHQMGVYKKLPDDQVYNYRPVYKLENGTTATPYYFFYNDDGQWMLSREQTGNKGGIRTIKKELVTPLDAEYLYHDKDDGRPTVDNKLTVKSLGEIQLQYHDVHFFILFY